MLRMCEWQQSESCAAASDGAAEGSNGPEAGLVSKGGKQTFVMFYFNSRIPALPSVLVDHYLKTLKELGST